ncbi:branched-chain amino acid aminotransferase [Chrysochromulina tobinii]|uniref:Branched-chain amino acid aminotransferase n=1 Tax=Chrysochromulina tobinii TaxID=1460289 RepID=A0A0M0J5Q3_9EUKA|nr:branched-chain amino acid aminotransferase [Chrysochromulina tobinii]|eukprot:KOO21931.1 branched-chain amino acid aminotransferase [Chrysochromulina sp. CCMP291]
MLGIARALPRSAVASWKIRTLGSDATSVSPRELELLLQVSRLEGKLAEAEAHLPPRTEPARITNWEELAFGILPTNGHVRHTWSSKTSSWDAGRFIRDPYMNMHIHAGVLHYGMTLFEGCKAFRCADGRIRVCNLDENSARMNTGAARLVMAPVPKKMFNKAIDWAVRANAEFVPPYGSGGSMYIRPFLMGSGPILGLQPCPEFTFMVAVTPVGNYFGKGVQSGVHAVICQDFDRAAPRGTGGVKAGGNYAADLLPLKLAKAGGFGTTLYLDAKENQYVEEFSVSNFLGITKNGEYVTPHSPSILPSITNKMLMQLAKDKGLTVQPRPVSWEEVKTMDEVGACGTATVVAPIASITDGDVKYEFGKFEVLNELRKTLMAIQLGEEEDRHGWMREVEI